jgi:hypothetical protein
VNHRLSITARDATRFPEFLGDPGGDGASGAGPGRTGIGIGMGMGIGMGKGMGMGKRMWPR